MTVQVAWGDMDSFQHVNNTVYLRWFESARIVYFDQLGMGERMRSERVGPILARTVIDYRKPVTYPDTVRVDVWPTLVGKSSFTLGYAVHSAQQNAVVASGETVIVLVDYKTGRSVALDDGVRAALVAGLAAQLPADPIASSEESRGA